MKMVIVIICAIGIVVEMFKLIRFFAEWAIAKKSFLVQEKISRKELLLYRLVMIVALSTVIIQRL